MRAQIAITRNGITQASSDKSPPEGGVLARRTNGDYLISLHRHVNERAFVQMMRSLRALGILERMNELFDERGRSISELEGVIASLRQPLLSQHLARLRRANIIRTRHETQTIYYTIDDSDVPWILRLVGYI